MHVLGISCHYHDAAAALLRDGRLVAAAQEERFSRRKHDAGFPARAIAFCLARAGLRPGDVDYAVFYEKPFLKAERVMRTVLATFPRSFGVFRESTTRLLRDTLWVRETIQRTLGLDAGRVLFVDHHASHAASAFFASPFEEAALLTVDGVGEWTTAAVGRARANWSGDGVNRITLDEELRFPHSLGLLYSVFTAFLGFEVNEGEYKVMGMAPFGRPRHVDRIRRMLDLRPDGSLWIDPAYVAYPWSTRRTFTRAFEELFGRPRDPAARFVAALAPPPPGAPAATPRELAHGQYYADVAASIQQVTEDVLLAMARHAHRRSGLPRLCLAGGVALNGVANYRLLRETPFEEIYVQPAAGDAGGALGAALYAHHVLLGGPRTFVLDHPSWGRAYRTGEIVDTLRAAAVPYEVVGDDERLLDRVVDALGAGAVVGWFSGAFEWGPRALGARSILADPRRPEMKDVVNTRIKFREPFRPFAGSVPVERAAPLFALDEAVKHFPPRFMLYVVPVTSDRIPAVTHVDGSSRPQLVAREVQPRYHRLLEKFGEATGVPLVLNTSFNLRGEPIVGSPADALDTFRRSGLDLLVLEDVVVRRPPAARG